MNQKLCIFIILINIDHGHTYYSAGYSKEFILKIFSNKIKLVECGELGTLVFTSIHLLKDWITTRKQLAEK